MKTNGGNNMKRHFIKKPVMAGDNFWSQEVRTVDDAKLEIKKALSAGCTLADILDYIEELEWLGNITNDEAIALNTWASSEYDKL